MLWSYLPHWMPSQKSSVNRVVAIDTLCGFEIRRTLIRARLTKGSDQMWQICSYAMSYDRPDPMLYTCGSAIPAAVSVNKELFCGTADGIQALVCTFGISVVCNTSNRRGNTPPEAYARAHVPWSGAHSSCLLCAQRRDPQIFGPPGKPSAWLVARHSASWKQIRS
jgi:hypothetical protein